MKVVSRIFKVLSWLVYLVIAIALLTAAPILFGNRPVVILSGSMEPAYPVGSIIYYKAAAFSDITVGDAITFKMGDGGSLATHRVTAVNTEEQSFVTKGDHNETEDPTPVLYANVVGKSSKIAIPYLGYFTKYVQQWYIIAIMGVILLLDTFLDPDEKKEKKKTNILAAEEFLPASGDTSVSSEAPAGKRTETVKKSQKAEKKKKDVSAADFFQDL